MPKASDTEIYNYKDIPSLSDYLFGTDSENNKKNKNFSLNSIIQLINGVNGVNNIQFAFSDASNPDASYFTKGLFFTDTNEGSIGDFSKLIFNKNALQPIDLTLLFKKLATVDNLVLKILDPAKPDCFFNFKILNIENETDYFVFDVEVFSNFFLGNLQSETIYSIYFDTNENSSDKLDRGGYSGTAKDLDDQIKQISLPDQVTKNGVITIEGLNISIDEDEFNWRINQVDFTNTPEFSSVIDAATDNFFRSDLLQGNNLGQYSIKKGIEGEFSSTAPEPDANHIALQVINVQGASIGEPVPAPDLSAIYFKRFKQTYKTEQLFFDINPLEDDYNIIFTNTNPSIIKLYPNGSFGKFIKNNSTHPFKSMGTADVTVIAEPGVILNAPNGTVLNKGQQCYLIKDDFNEWTLVNPFPKQEFTDFQESVVAFAEYVSEEFNDVNNNKADKLTTYTKVEVDAKVTSIYKIKPSVADFESLPMTGNEIGDTRNLLSTGMNYVWDGAAWDALGTTVDLSSKQDTLVSGENLKTLNNQSILGPGNIEILADGTVPLSAFLDTINGDDTTALIENPRKTFKTINALLTALPAWLGETYTIYIVAGNVPFTRKISRRNLRFIAYNDTTMTFEGVKESDGITNASFLFNDAGGADRVWTFENSNISFSCSRDFRFGREFNTGVIFKGNINNLTWASNFIYIQPSTNLKINNVSNFGGTIMSSGIGADRVPSYIEIDFFNITNNANIINQYKGILRINNLVKTNIGTANYIQFSIPNSGTNDITLEFKNITHNGIIETFVSKINFIDATINNLANFNFGRISGFPQTIVSGVLDSTLFLDSGYFTNGAYFKNFTGRIGGATLANGSYTFENCNITCNTTLTNRWSGATLKEALFFKGYNTITQLVASDLIGAEAETIVEVAGVVKTNAKSFGSKAKSIYPNATFKEKLFEVVVRSKSDIINKVLDSATTYIIDGKLTLLADEYIEVPSTGLTLVGYGFNVSGLTKNVSGQSIFKSPASGGSGDFITRDIVYNSGAGSVFNLNNVAGNNAIEMNDVNFDNCGSLGKLTGYRQFTGTTNGFYGCQDGFQVSGNWSGFKLTNSNVLAFGGSGTFIKKDTDTLFSNRVYLDLNLSFATGAKLSDFQESNFNGDELFQINNTLLRIGGVVDNSNTALALPNISANNPKCRWTNCIGITLTAQKFQDLKSATKNWRISVNDAGIITATEI